MTVCRVCNHAHPARLADFGPQPIGNRLLDRPVSTGEYRHPLRLQQCHRCATIQLDVPPPAAELRPRTDWITYEEPEGHLDTLADTLAVLAPPDGAFGGISFKDDTLLRRMRERGFRRTWRLDPRADLGIDSIGAGVETVQAHLTPERARRIAAVRGRVAVLLVRHILEHAFDARAFVAALRELVEPGGHIVFEVPDCSPALEGADVSTIWEEHVLYFTPETYRNGLSHWGLELIRYDCFGYAHENELVAVVRANEGTRPQLPDAVTLDEELARGQHFARSIEIVRRRARVLLERARTEVGPVAILGAGHVAVTFVSLHGIADLLELVADDNPNKQGRFLPGCALPILPSSSLIDKGIRLCLLTVNPEVEQKVVDKNAAFGAAGGRFASIFPASSRALGIAPPFRHARLRSMSDEVFYASGPLPRLDADALARLKAIAARAPRGRARICAHVDVAEPVHEMTIVHRRRAYVRPHRHPDKTESMQILQGTADLIFLDAHGEPEEVVPMGDMDSARTFYYRMNTPRYHTMIITSEFLVFQEVTKGPFVSTDTEFPSWAPDESDPVAIEAFMERMEAFVRAQC